MCVFLQRHIHDCRTSSAEAELSSELKDGAGLGGLQAVRSYEGLSKASMAERPDVFIGNGMAKHVIRFAAISLL